MSRVLLLLVSGCVGSVQIDDTTTTNPTDDPSVEPVQPPRPTQAPNEYAYVRVDVSLPNGDDLCSSILGDTLYIEIQQTAMEDELVAVNCAERIGASIWAGFDVRIRVSDLGYEYFGEDNAGAPFQEEPVWYYHASEWIELGTLQPGVEYNEQAVLRCIDAELDDGCPFENSP